VYGHVRPSERVFLRPGSIDLIAVENGGEVVQVSDRFFGPPSNLLLPGRGVNMGDGWETARRRTPGTDWAVVQLGRPGTVQRIELDTHFFKGNAPQAVTIEARSGDGAWKTLLAKTTLEPHRKHVLYPDRAMVITQARVHIHPHGGVNRLRMFGEPIDSAAVSEKLAAFNTQADPLPALLALNGSKAWAAQMAAARPFASARALLAKADAIWWSLTEKDWLEAFAAHPRLGEKKAAASQNTQSATWSSGEQAGIGVDTRLADANARYFDKHGFIFIFCATGRTAPEVLEAIEARLATDRQSEIDTAAAEQAKISRLRMEKWLAQKSE
jgi:allantoicase